jgi:protein-tyrosine phosphatase
MIDMIPKGRNDTHVFDYSVITENIILGSDFCNGRGCKEHEKEFNKLSVASEINLSVEKKETPPSNIESYMWTPVVDGYAPSMTQFDVGTAAINEIVKNGRVIYVHCTNGHGRSPTMVAAYLVRYKKLSVDEAIKFIKQKRPEIHIEDTQKEALDKYLAKCSK